jgi:hypothetical protein
MSIQDLKMTYSAKITLKYDSTWEQTRGVYDDVVPEEHITFEAPVEDMDTIQLFQFFAKFASAMGHNEVGIAKGAAYVSFNEMRTPEAMRKTADDYDLKLIEDYNDKLWEIEKLEAEVRDLKAKLSRALDPENPNYTDDEIEAMTEEIIAEAFQPTMKTLMDAEVVCKDCGSKYGTYSVGCSSTWMGKCNVCGKDKPVTEVRDWGYLAKGIGELKK